MPEIVTPGGGDVLHISGYVDAATAVKRLAVSAGGSGAKAFIHSVAPPGEVIGNRWEALLPLLRVDAATDFELAAEAVLRNGRAAPHWGLSVPSRLTSPPDRRARAAWPSAWPLTSLTPPCSRLKSIDPRSGSRGLRLHRLRRPLIAWDHQRNQAHGRRGRALQDDRKRHRVGFYRKLQARAQFSPGQALSIDRSLGNQPAPGPQRGKSRRPKRGSSSPQVSGQTAILATTGSRISSSPTR